ncbi:hypothetical protein MKQ70_30605 [Chitinophaga sedimenti]|uniref:hypothetical protein n=1 Tax=Chitinophaga sedimenti TaxID=2033606 RepID=UPI002005F228|nr:hypothetical protein [Chitinophaga sedimenti]MCK7559092.1 hypothetical protein [Chitinophaga sedimenti]
MSHNEVIDKIEQRKATVESQEVLIDLVNEDNKSNRVLWVIIGIIGVVLIAGVYAYFYGLSHDAQTRVGQFADKVFTKDLFFYIGVGLAAQMIDGALGMAYGASSSSMLLSLGIPPLLPAPAYMWQKCLPQVLPALHTLNWAT